MLAGPTTLQCANDAATTRAAIVATGLLTEMSCRIKSGDHAAAQTRCSRKSRACPDAHGLTGQTIVLNAAWRSSKAR